jgi:hypothetical protein
LRSPDTTKANGNSNSELRIASDAEREGKAATASATEKLKIIGCVEEEATMHQILDHLDR